MNKPKKSKTNVALLENYNQHLRAVLQAAVNYALQLQNAGDLNAAINCYQSILVIEPMYFDALHLMGVAQGGLGQLEKGIEFIKRALNVNPHSDQALVNLGNIYGVLGQHHQAFACYEKALQFNPANPDACSNISNHYGRLGDNATALKYVEKAVNLAPHNANHWVNYSCVLVNLLRFDDAIAACNKALAIKPNIVMAYNNLGNTYFAGGKYELALENFNRVLELDSSFDRTYGQRLEMKMRLCIWDNFAQELAQLEQMIAAGRGVVMPFPFQSMSHDPHIIKQVAIQYGKTISHNVTPQPLKACKHDKIRVGYYSPDFRIHAVGHLVQGLFAAHNRDEIELYGFWYGPDANDEVRQAIAAQFGAHFYDVRFKSDAELAQFSRQLEIDIAVDLAGYTLGNRVAAFGHRCAPVQISYIGFPGTLGLDYIDYMIADHTVIPAQMQQYFTEKIIYMPESYQVNHKSLAISERVFSRTELGLPETGVVYACFNNGYKLNPQMLDCWVNILKAVPGSVLWLVADGALMQENLKREAELRGLDGARLVFAERMPLADHLARQRTADIFLDTIPYNGHGTSSAALWAGLPVLTVAGNTFPGRVSASLLNTLGLPELITPDLVSYQEKAIVLGKNPKQIAQIKQTLQASLENSPLYDIVRFTRFLEQAYQQAYALALAGKSPEHIG